MGHTATRGSTRHISGTVTLLGSWNGAQWRILSTVRAESPSGHYRFTLRPDHRGVLRLRLEVPGGLVYPVTLTIV
jgi:hypothetical protein